MKNILMSTRKSYGSSPAEYGLNRGYSGQLFGLDVGCENGPGFSGRRSVRSVDRRNDYGEASVTADLYLLLPAISIIGGGLVLVVAFLTKGEDE